MFYYCIQERIPGINYRCESPCSAPVGLPRPSLLRMYLLGDARNSFLNITVCEEGTSWPLQIIFKKLELSRPLMIQLKCTRAEYQIKMFELIGNVKLKKLQVHLLTVHIL